MHICFYRPYAKIAHFPLTARLFTHFLGLVATLSLWSPLPLLY